MYRLTWAKLITDECFDGIKNEISNRFSGFDMDKGIADSVIEKILKNYRSRGFKEEEIGRYLKAWKKKQEDIKLKNSNRTQSRTQKYSSDEESSEN